MLKRMVANFMIILEQYKKDHPLFGLNIMKQSFGGDFYEFSGEFDLVNNKVLYLLFKLLIPIRRKIKYFFLKYKK